MTISTRTAMLNAVCLVLAAGALAAGFATNPSAQEEPLYALEQNGSAFRIIDRTTGADVATISTSVDGGWRGIATSPLTRILYAAETESLYTLDSATGATTEIGLFGSVAIRDLTFDDSGQLYGVSGTQGSNSGSLHLIDIDTGAAAFVADLGGNGGHGIASDPEQPGTIHHLAYDTLLAGGSGIFERIDLGTGDVLSIGLAGDPIDGRPLGLVHDPVDGVFRFFDDTNRYYAVAPDGTVSAIGTQNPTRYFGLAFGASLPIFGDGFESGDTAAWSSTVP